MRVDAQDGAAGDGRLTRRTLLQRAAGLGLAASTLGALDLLALTPAREAIASKSPLPEIQFQIERFSPRAIRVEGVQGAHAARLHRVRDLRADADADRGRPGDARGRAGEGRVQLPVQPERRLHDGRIRHPLLRTAARRDDRDALAANMPRLLAERQRYVLEEAVPGPTDVSPPNPGVSKLRFQVPVQIEANDVLVTVRSDSSANDRRRPRLALRRRARRSPARPSGPRASAGCSTVTSRRLMFTQIGLPRKVAEEAGLAVRRDDQPALADVDGLRLPAGRQQRAAGDHDLRRQRLAPSSRRRAATTTSTTARSSTSRT